jgi:hypothetical protein
MRADRQTVLAAVRDPQSLLRLGPAELDLALRQLRRVKLLARTALGLQRLGVFEGFATQVRDQFTSALRMAEARARLAQWELQCLARVLRPARQSPVIALKGSAYLLLDLPFAEGRMMTDVDLLVPEQQLARTEALLREAGWHSAPLKEYDERYYRDWTHEIPPLRHVEREMEVDVHHNVLQRTARLKPQARLLVDDARPAGSSGYAVLSPADMTLHAMTHLFYSGELDDALRDLVDIDALLRIHAEREPQFWPNLAERARLLQLRRPAWYALRYCVRWLGTPVPAATLEAIGEDAPAAPAQALMDRLVPAALFARHPDRDEPAAGAARLLLLGRSHWIRMPPSLLLKHLSRKMLRRTLPRGSRW